MLFRSNTRGETQIRNVPIYSTKTLKGKKQQKLSGSNNGRLSFGGGIHQEFHSSHLFPFVFSKLQLLPTVELTDKTPTNFDSALQL